MVVGCGWCVKNGHGYSNSGYGLSASTTRRKHRTQRWPVYGVSYVAAGFRKGDLRPVFYKTNRSSSQFGKRKQIWKISSSFTPS